MHALRGVMRDFYRVPFTGINQSKSFSTCRPTLTRRWPKIFKILDAVTLASVLMYYRCNAKLGGQLTLSFPMTF
jgi:hypothetical protein